VPGSPDADEITANQIAYRSELLVEIERVEINVGNCTSAIAKHNMISHKPSSILHPDKFRQRERSVDFSSDFLCGHQLCEVKPFVRCLRQNQE